MPTGWSFAASALSSFSFRVGRALLASFRASIDCRLFPLSFSIIRASIRGSSLFEDTGPPPLLTCEKTRQGPGAAPAPLRRLADSYSCQSLRINSSLRSTVRVTHPI